jgi:hypothetical protein
MRTAEDKKVQNKLRKRRWLQTEEGKRKNRERTKAWKLANPVKAKAIRKASDDKHKDEISADHAEQYWRLQDMAFRWIRGDVKHFMEAGLSIVSEAVLRAPTFWFDHGRQRTFEQLGD